MAEKRTPLEELAEAIGERAARGIEWSSLMGTYRWNHERMGKHVLDPEGIIYPLLKVLGGLAPWVAEDERGDLSPLEWLHKEGLSLDVAEACLEAAGIEPHEPEPVLVPHLDTFEPGQPAVMLTITNDSMDPVVVRLFSRQAEMVGMYVVPANSIQHGLDSRPFIRATATWTHYRGGSVRYLWREA